MDQCAGGRYWISPILAQEASGYVPGVLGTNLFTDRDLILNGDVNTPYLGISPILTPQWNVDANGTWGTDSNWIMGVPDADVQDAPANFLSAITAPRTITVDANYTAGSITFNNTNSYTLAGPGTITLSNSSGTATIEVITGSHTIAAPLNLLNNTTITIDAAGSKLSITGAITTSNTITKSGPGILALGGSATQLGNLSVQQGILQFMPHTTSTFAAPRRYPLQRVHRRTQRMTRLSSTTPAIRLPWCCLEISPVGTIMAKGMVLELSPR